MTKVLMKGPPGTCSANIMGHEYDVEGDIEEGGTVTVRNPDHIEVLERHGFKVEGADEEAADEAETDEHKDEDETETAEKPKKKKKKGRKNR